MTKCFVITFFLSVLLIGCKKGGSEKGMSQANEFGSIYSKQGYGLLEVVKVEELVNGIFFPHYNAPGLNHCFFYDSLT